MTNTANSLSARFDPANPRVTVATSDGTVGFAASGGASVKPVVSEDAMTVTYSEVWPGVDLVYEVNNNGVKESLVIRKPTDQTEFAFDMTGATLTPGADPSGYLPPMIEGKLGASLSFVPPTGVDASGASIDQTVQPTLVARSSSGTTAATSASAV